MSLASARDLAGFGWSPHFHAQLTADEIGRLAPVRVAAVYRNGLDVVGPDFNGRLRPFTADEGEDESLATVGDWLLVDPATAAPVRILERRSLFKRKAAGTVRRIQLIAANVDTLLVVTSCNHDFNPARLERYLVLARQAGVVPLVVLTKADLAEDAADYEAAARKLAPGLMVETLDARAGEVGGKLGPWCGRGQTVALVGSSGVGKSTLTNTLLGAEHQATAGIREDDSRGRHTTSGRSLHRLAGGGWVIDTPGMRELQLADAGEGIDDLFADVTALAGRCRFGDCRHNGEPGCAIEAALAAGELDPQRYRRYRKLAAEEVQNSLTISERRSRDRVFGKMAKSVMAGKRQRREL